MNPFFRNTLLRKSIPIGALVLAAVFFGSSCKNRSEAPSPSSHSSEAAVEDYTCPMHPDVHSNSPGECPICHMTLQKVESPRAEKKIKYYRNPMDPSIHSDKPTKDSMGMDYVPVYAEETQTESKIDDLSRGAVSMSPASIELSGTRVTKAEVRDLIVEIRAPGRALGGTRVSFQVFEHDLPLIKSGIEFTVETPAAPGATIVGRVTSVESILDPMTRTVRVDGTLTEGASNRLRTEASLVGTLKVKIPRALTIPEESVLHLGSRDLVYLSSGNGKFAPRLVELGVKGSGRYQVMKGLDDGALISAGPNFLLDSESRVQYSHD